MRWRFIGWSGAAGTLVGGGSGRRRGDLREGRRGRGLDDQLGGREQRVERQERRGRAKALEEPLGLLAVAGGRSGPAQARDALVEGAAPGPPAGGRAPGGGLPAGRAGGGAAAAPGSASPSATRIRATASSSPC